MITCRELADALGDLVAGDLPPDRRQVIEQHLHHCPPCEDLLEEYRLTIRLARQLPPLSMPPTLCTRLQAALASPHQQPDHGAGGAP
jgi:anti-sigma factor RsiW